MKFKFILTCFVLTSSMFCQIADRPTDYKKILFVYEIKSNYYIDSQKVYADTLLFKIDFPNLKYTLTNKLTKNEMYNCFIPLINFKADDIEKLLGIIYHTNQEYIGEYDSEKDETNFKIIRNDEVTKKIFKNISRKSHKYFEYSIKINYIKIQFK